MATAAATVGRLGAWGQLHFTPRHRSQPVPHPPSTPGTPARDGAPRVSVCVRVRPVGPRPSLGSDPGSSVLDVNEAAGELCVGWHKSFKFDHVLSGDASQAHLYRQAVAPTIEAVLQGANATIFAYGQTGTGKTFTMGTDGSTGPAVHEREGVIPRVVQALFQRVTDEYTLKVSFFEILNEKVYDLLKVLKMKVPLKLKEEGHEFTIPDLTTKIVTRPDEALALLERGCQTRSTSSTAQNAASSRSHAIFKITLISTNPEGHRMERKISLVDLAGSESAGKSNEDHQRRTEGVNINKGLSVLGRCISAICDKDRHIPFRDSNLTKVLRECLTGDGRTTMIACVSPTEADVKETMNTLRYADCVKRMEKPPIPAHLLQIASQEKSAQKRRQQMIPPTPLAMRHRLNHTIETPTPTKRKRMESLASQPMNATVPHGAPDFEGFVTPNLNGVQSRGTHFPTMSSTVAKMPSLETIEDEDSISNVSSIQYSTNASVNQSISSGVSLADARSVFSPLMREMKLDLKRHIDETMKSLETSILMTSSKSSRPDRMTSSPRRRSQRLSKKVLPDLDKSDPSMEETMISGPNFPAIRQKMRENIEAQSDMILSTLHTKVLNTPLVDVTNRRSAHLKRVEATASPTLKGMDQDKENAMVPRTPNSFKKGLTDKTNIPMSVLEEQIGLNPGSPLLFDDDPLPFCGPPAPRSSVKRSVRRTTMMHNELNQSLVDASRVVKKNPVRRSIRISAQQSDPLSPFRHPLAEKNPWQVKNQQVHNQNILGILNSANMSMLQRLPGIGPKSAIIIHTQRELRGSYTSISDLRGIPGLQKNFFTKFLDKNQIVLH